MDRVEIARIEIVKYYDDEADGGESVYVTYSDDLSLIDALGMLQFATWATPDTFTAEDDE